MPDVAPLRDCCPYCRTRRVSGADYALHLEGHFRAGIEDWVRGLLPRIVERELVPA